jgi:hypothetical protein
MDYREVREAVGPYFEREAENVRRVESKSGTHFHPEVTNSLQIFGWGWSRIVRSVHLAFSHTVRQR